MAILWHKWRVGIAVFTSIKQFTGHTIQQFSYPKTYIDQ
jgi:hypothetical protein